MRIAGHYPPRPLSHVKSWLQAVEFPYLCLLVSGGHSMLLVAHGVGDYTLLGTSLDDSVGAPAALFSTSHAANPCNQTGSSLQAASCQLPSVASSSVAQPWLTAA